MEYKGQVCLKKGKLVITYAECNKVRRCLEELIGYESTRKKKVYGGKKRNKSLKSKNS